MVLEQLYGRRSDYADEEMKDDDLVDRSCNDTKFPYPFVEVSARFNIPVNFITVYEPENNRFFRVVDVSVLDFLPTDKTDFNFTVNNRFEDKVLTYGELFASLNQRFHFPLEWLKLCNDYVVSLKPEEKMLLYSYTYQGDIIANRLVRSVHQYTKHHQLMLQRNGERVIPGQVARMPDVEDVYEMRGKFFSLYFPIRTILLTRPVEQYLKDPSDATIVGAAQSLVQELKESLESWNANLKPYKRLTQKHGELEMLFNEKLIVDATVLYTQEINNIICNAPPLTQDALVFRGVKHDLFYSLDNKTTFQNVHLMSTSYSLHNAYYFSLKDSSRCCLKYILLPKGTHCIWLDLISQSKGEHEILLPTDNTFEIVESSIIPRLTYTGFAKNQDVETKCDVGQNKMKTTILKLVSQACS